MDPYIGVTGFMDRLEVVTALGMLDTFERSGFNLQRKLMVGVLASSKTIAGGTNKYPNRYPKVGQIASIFPPDRRTLNLIHYATDDQATLREQIKKLVELGGPHLDGFQFNIAWPAPEAICVPGMRVVLQIGSRALEECGYDPEQVWRKLTYYDPEVTDVLIDASGGKGLPIDVPSAKSYVMAITEQIPQLGIGIAGGLSAGTLDPIHSLLKTYPQVSIDAEGKLRDANDDLSMEAVTDFIEAAYMLFS